MVIYNVRVHHVKAGWGRCQLSYQYYGGRGMLFKLGTIVIGILILFVSEISRACIRDYNSEKAKSFHYLATVSSFPSINTIYCV